VCLFIISLLSLFLICHTCAISGQQNLAHVTLAVAASTLHPCHLRCVLKAINRVGGWCCARNVEGAWINPNFADAGAGAKFVFNTKQDTLW
jgi:hypothetical protein